MEGAGPGPLPEISAGNSGISLPGLLAGIPAEVPLVKKATTPPVFDVPIHMSLRPIYKDSRKLTRLRIEKLGKR